MNEQHTSHDNTTHPVAENNKWYSPNARQFLFGGIIFFLGAVLLFISMMHFEVIELTSNRITLIAISLVLVWGVIMVGFYVWAIYNFNINLGYQQRYWDILWQKIRESRIRKKAGLPPLEDEPKIPNQNPYKNETLGLPHGTVRATIALTLLVGSLAMIILAVGAVHGASGTLAKSTLSGSQSILFNRLFDFFVVAFQMMIAFYFGANSLKYLKGNNNNTSGSDPAPYTPPPADPSIPHTLEHGGDKTPLPPTSSGTTVETGGQISPDVFQNKAKALGLQPAALRAIATMASGGQGFIKEAGNETGNGRLSLTFDGKNFYTELQKAGKNPAPLVNDHAEVLWEKCQNIFGHPGASAYNLLQQAIEVARSQGLSAKTALLAGNWGLFGVPGKLFAQAGYPDIINLQNKFELSEANQFDAFIALCKNKGWFTLLQGVELDKFAVAYWGNCAVDQNYGEELKSLYQQFVQSGENGTAGTPGAAAAKSASAGAAPKPNKPTELGGHKLLDPTEIGESDDL